MPAGAVDCLTQDTQDSDSGALSYQLFWGFKTCDSQDKWIKRISAIFPWKQNLNKAGGKSKHDNASSTRLMSRTPVITECFHAHIIQDKSSCPGDRHPDQICVYTMPAGFVKIQICPAETLPILKLTQAIPEITEQ